MAIHHGKLTTIYIKACHCPSKVKTATNTFRFSEEEVRDKILTTVRFYPGPSCEECGKPWKEIKGEDLVMLKQIDENYGK